MGENSLEKYEFNWVGKKEAFQKAFTPVEKVLIPDKDSSIDWDLTENIYIEGDNLDALKLLQKDFSKKVKMIYIDPPYNTGKDFIYNDRRKQHSEWCSMIYPRLILAKNLLCDDGVIFISIDDNEVFNLKKICDEVFGEENFIQQFIYEKTQHFGRQKLNAYSNAEYILCYAKKLFDGKLKQLLVERINTELLDAPLYNASNNISVITFPKNSVKFNISDGIYEKTSSPDYELINSVEVKDGKNKNSFALKFKSRWSANTVLEEIKKGTTFLVKTKSFAIRAIYSDKKSTNVAPKQIIFTNSLNSTYTRFGKKIGTSEVATRDLKKLMGENLFSYPKDVSLISYLISILYDYKNKKFEDDFIILDFFSGSATTAEACMELNALDGGKRKFILVQQFELINKKFKISGYNTICDIGKERIRRSGNELKKTFTNIDTGFRVCKLINSKSNQ